MTPIDVVFRPRSTPLDASGAVATGRTACALARRLLAQSDDRLTALSGVSARSLLAVVGASDELPWVDGIIYVGRDATAPGLLIPTTLEPSVPLALLERALSRRGQLETPLLVLHRPPRLVSLANARPILRARLSTWLAAHAEHAEAG